MSEIVGIEIPNEQMKYFYTNKLNLKKNLTVIVETEDGLRFGKVVTDIHPIDNKKLKEELYKVIRIASKQDYEDNKKNEKDIKESIKKFNSLTKKYNLEMKLQDAYYTHDRQQLIFKFTSENRVDFRDLAKDLASIYHTRIELRQIGVRDKAKKISGLGLCGQILCCSRFLDDFSSVSIQMAKDQNIALNPTKINGLCGRLLCCLKYEEECYKECRKGLPNVGKTVTTSSGREGKVVSVDVLKRKFRVETPFGIEEEELGSIK